MTFPDHDPLLDDGPLDDETLAVHAVVDDEATAEQRRRVARDPELVARVAALRATVAAVAEPVDPPPATVLADLRRRALDALDEPAATPEVTPDPDPEVPAATTPIAPPAPTPVGDLGAARARRTRKLPPLPAVAAVVVLLVLVGVGLIVAGTGGKGESSADSASSGAGGDSAGATVAADSSGDDQAEAEAPAAESGDGALDEEFDRPADELRDDLLGQVTTQYATEADLLRDLREVDPLALPLTGRSAADPDETTPPTTVPDATTTTAMESTTTQTTTQSASVARAYAADPVATRCDDVLRSAEPDLDPAVAAVLVEVDGEPVVVLSNPVEVTDRAPSGLRLTALNAIDCTPRGAVLR